MKRIVLPALLFLFVSIVLSSSVLGEIQSSQVLIVGNTQSTASLDLAKKYAQARSVPSRNILMLDLPLSEEITREQYNHRIAFPIRMFLRQQKLENDIKVLVTMFGVPLRVKAAEPTRAQLLLAQQVRQKFYAVFKQMEEDYRSLEKLAGITATQPATLPGGDNIDEFYREIPAITAKITGLMQKAVTLAQAKSDTVERQAFESQFVRIRLDFQGQVAMAMVMQDQVEKNKDFFTQFRNSQKEFGSLVASPPEKRDLEHTYKSAREIGGFLLTLRTMYEDYCRLMQKESISAVDSELSLVLWDNYSLAGRQPNPLNPRFAEHFMAIGKGPVLMVSRLDGPEPSVVERIIRDSIKVERNGLAGHFYLDARGIKEHNGYYQYDEDLRQLAEMVKDRTKMPAVLDNRPELFAPNACPDTALYCGWYSLKKYIPAFSFVPGSVGYHIASFEAITLRQSKSNTWVKRMLENGITATLGPVEEPFLDSFPLPSEFFGLLMTGKYNLAEVYYRTNRYTSWRIILIGDPLYKPFAKCPILEEKDVPSPPLPLVLYQ